MKLTKEGLIQHLKKCRRDLDYEDLIWVFGNESVDLDSVVASLMYAYFLDGVAVINCKKDEFACKTEALFLLKELSISVDDLIFVDNIKRVPGRVVLVDHNELSESLADLGDVWHIVDHHRKSGKHPGAEFTRIEKVGSCSTLIFDLIDKATSIDDVDLLKMIAGPILLDTFNLDSGVGKATELDRNIIEKVMKRGSFDRNAWFRDLLEAKKDITGLTSKQLLQKDCKYWSDFVISSIPIPLSDFLENSNDEIEQFFNESGKKVYLIMSLFEELEFERELLIYVGPEWTLEEKVIQILQQGGLDLTPINMKRNYLCFKQNNIILSRKEVAPLIQEIFRGSHL